MPTVFDWRLLKGSWVILLTDRQTDMTNDTQTATIAQLRQPWRCNKQSGVQWRTSWHVAFAIVTRLTITPTLQNVQYNFPICDFSNCILAQEINKYNTRTIYEPQT